MGESIKCAFFSAFFVFYDTPAYLHFFYFDFRENEDLAYELEGINWIRKTKPIEKQIEKLIERICKHYGIVVEDSNLYSNNKSDIQENVKYTKTLLLKWLFRILFFLGVILLLWAVASKYIRPDNNEVNNFTQKETIIQEYNETELIPPELKFDKENHRKEVQKFLNSFYKVGELNSVVKALQYYADNVDAYFHLKNIKKDKIIEDKLQYYKKFPVREYKLVEFEIVDSYKKNGQYILLVYATVKWRVINQKNVEKLGETTQRLKLIQHNGKYLVKSIETIDRKQIKKSFFVCYKNDIQKNGDIAYIGCVKNNNPCIDNHLKHFGKYKSKLEQQEAFSRCINAVPRVLYKVEIFNLSDTKDGFLALREEPKGALIGKLYNGEKLGVLEKRGRWLKVKVEDSNRIGWVYGKWVRKAKVSSNDDLQIKIGENIRFGNIDAKIVSFGGINTPECKFAISVDGVYVYYKKLHSTCVRLENSNKIKIVCNSDKTICKTRKELIDAVIKHKNSPKH